MSDPVRWKEGGDAPADLGDVLRRAPRPRVMSPAERARTAARLAKGAAAVGTGIGWAAWAKGLAVVAGLGAAGVVAHGAHGALASRPDPVPVASPLRHPPADRSRPVEPAPPAPVAGDAAEVRPSPVPAPPVATTAGVQPSSPARAAPALDPAPPPGHATPSATPPQNAAAPQSPAPPAGAAAPASDADALLREAELLEKARADLARDPGASLRALDEHRDGFGDGQLAAERELLAIEALARQGRGEEARARARAFQARFPVSPYAARVARILGTNP
ncbi:MAG: hypothetical protein QM820_33780 [Minicystis sp.]